MHLFYLNLAPYMKAHWDGTFSPNLSGGGLDETVQKVITLHYILI